MTVNNSSVFQVQGLSVTESGLHLNEYFCFYTVLLGLYFVLVYIIIPPQVCVCVCLCVF